MNRAAAVLHQRLGQMRHPHEGPARHIHGREEAVARHICHPAPQRLLGRKGYRVHQKIQPPHSCLMRSKTASIWPSSPTSNGIRIGAFNSRARGSTNFFALSLR